jgi:hypothetical protein
MGKLDSEGHSRIGYRRNELQQQSVGGMTMKIAVHRFQVWDSIRDTMETPSRYAAVDEMKENAHCVPVPGTEVLIDACELNSEGMTAKRYGTPDGVGVIHNEARHQDDGAIFAVLKIPP